MARWVRAGMTGDNRHANHGETIDFQPTNATKRPRVYSVSDSSIRTSERDPSDATGMMLPRSAKPFEL